MLRGILSFFLVFTTLIYAEQLRLVDGWNLVGVNSRLTLSELKTRIGTDNLLVIQGEKKTYQKEYFYNGKDFLNSFTIFEKGKGYWIKVNSTVDIAYDKKPYTAEETIDLIAGWNLINPPSDLNISEITTQLSSRLEVIQGVNKTYQKAYIVEGKEFLNSFTKFEEPQGYWVKVNETAILHFPIDSSQNHSPKFTSSSKIIVNENQINAIRLTATDSDADFLTYFISGIDAGSFEINSSTGVIRFKEEPDFEIKDSYHFIAKVTDGKNNIAQDITILIKDISVGSRKYICRDNSKIRIPETGVSQLWDDFFESKTKSKAFKKNGLADYSYAGYKYSEKELDKAITEDFIGCEETVVLQGTGNDLKAIQDAINEAEENLENGATCAKVKFLKGEYTVDEADALDAGITITNKNPKLIHISKGNMMLYGEKNIDGSLGVIINYTSNREDLYTLKYTEFQNEQSPYLFTIRGLHGSADGDGSPIKIVKSAPRESFEVMIDGTPPSSMMEGSHIVLYLKDPKVANAELLAPKNIHDEWTYLKEGFLASEKHTIVKIETINNHTKLILKEPIHKAIDITYNWVVKAYYPIEQVVIQDLYLKGSWRGHPYYDNTFCHHRLAYDDFGYRALSMELCQNCAIKNIKLENWNAGIRIASSKAVSVQSVTFLGARGHHTVGVRGGSYGVLIDNLHDKSFGEQYYKNTPTSTWCKEGVAGDPTVTKNGFIHGSSLSGVATGTVFTNSIYGSYSGIDAHGHFPYVNLFDNLSSGFGGPNAGGNTNVKPNHLEGFVLWNHNELGVGGREKNYWRNTNGGKEESTEPFWHAWDNTYRKDDWFYKPTIVGFHRTDNQERTAFDIKESFLNALESDGQKLIEIPSLFEMQKRLRFCIEK